MHVFFGRLGDNNDHGMGHMVLNYKNDRHQIVGEIDTFDGNHPSVRELKDYALWARLGMVQ